MTTPPLRRGSAADAARWSAAANIETGTCSISGGRTALTCLTTNRNSHFRFELSGKPPPQVNELFAAERGFGVRRLDLTISIKCCTAHRARAACFIANSPEQGRDASPRRPCSLPDRHGILGGIFHPNGLHGGGFGETALPIAACAVNELWDKVRTTRRTPKATRPN